MFNRPWAFSTSTSESFSSLSATHSDIKGKSTIAKGLFECRHCCCGCYLWGLDSDWTECWILSHPTDTPSHTYHLPSSHHSSKHPLSLHGQTQPGLPHFILTVIQTTHNLSAGTHHLSPSSGSYFSTPNLHHLHPPLLPAYSSCFKLPFLSNATLFCSSRQNISIVSVVLFFSPLSTFDSCTHTLYSVTWAARNTSITHILIALLDNWNTTCFLAGFKYSFLNNHKSD